MFNLKKGANMKKLIAFFTMISIAAFVLVCLPIKAFSVNPDHDVGYGLDINVQNIEIIIVADPGNLATYVYKNCQVPGKIIITADLVIPQVYTHKICHVPGGTIIKSPLQGQSMSMFYLYDTIFKSYRIRNPLGTTNVFISRGYYPLKFLITI